MVKNVCDNTKREHFHDYPGHFTILASLDSVGKSEDEDVDDDHWKWVERLVEQTQHASTASSGQNKSARSSSGGSLHRLVINRMTLHHLNHNHSGANFTCSVNNSHLASSTLQTFHLDLNCKLCILPSFAQNGICLDSWLDTSPAPEKIDLPN